MNKEFSLDGRGCAIVPKLPSPSTLPRQTAPLCGDELGMVSPGVLYNMICTQLWIWSAIWHNQLEKIQNESKGTLVRLFANWNSNRHPLQEQGISEYLLSKSVPSTRMSRHDAPHTRSRPEHDPISAKPFTTSTS